jgi:methylmalonyl-CoA carboxyltransferase large subunit
MKSRTPDWAQLMGSLMELRQEVTRLGERVAALEDARLRGVAPAASARPEAESAEGLSEELLVVISAAIAAFLGKRPHIRQIRLLGSAAWAQQGRVTIQASHARSG